MAHLEKRQALFSLIQGKLQSHKMQMRRTLSQKDRQPKLGNTSGT
jgi:hypothetical protein